MQDNNSKGHNALTRSMWHNNTVRPIQTRALMHMKCFIISPWPVPELTGAQWVEPLPQAGYITIDKRCIMVLNKTPPLSETLTPTPTPLFPPPEKPLIHFLPSSQREHPTGPLRTPFGWMYQKKLRSNKGASSKKSLAPSGTPSAMIMRVPSTLTAIA